MRATPPRILPTLALVVLWIAVYFLWLAVRPADQVTVSRTGATPGASTTTAPPRPTSTP